MGKGVVFLLVLVFLTASSLVFTKPAVSSDELSESPWVPKLPMPVAGDGFKAGVVNDNVYVIRLNVTYEYNLYSWSTKKPMPTPRYNFALATYQNKIYCIGGTTDSTPSGINEVYDPASDSWESKAAMPTPRHGLEANVVNGKIYLISGLVQHRRFPDVKGTFELTNITEVYDPATDTWTTKAPIPNAVHSYASAVVNNKIYIISETHTHIYDPETDTWSYGAASPFPVDSAGGATVAGVTPQRVYVIGGRSAYDFEAAYTQAYDPENDSWSIGAPMPTARYGLAVAVANNTIYAIGGSIGIFYDVVRTDRNEQYDPLKDEAVPSMPSTLPPEPIPEPFPVVPVAAAVIAVAVFAVAACAGLLLLNRKRRQEAGPRA